MKTNQKRILLLGFEVFILTILILGHEFATWSDGSFISVMLILAALTWMYIPLFGSSKEKKVETVNRIQ